MKFEVVQFSEIEDAPEWLDLTSGPGFDATEFLTSDYDYRTAIAMRVGEKTFVEFDGGEPEDQTLNRDWRWVKDWLALAFEAGRADVLDSLMGEMAGRGL